MEKSGYKFKNRKWFFTYKKCVENVTVIVIFSNVKYLHCMYSAEVLGFSSYSMPKCSVLKVILMLC